MSYSSKENYWVNTTQAKLHLIVVPAKVKKSVLILYNSYQKNQSTSGIEKGEFIFYEVKSCKADYHSGNGLNFEGDRNYVVTTIETYKQIMRDVPWSVGVYVACPEHREPADEFESPTPIEDNTVNWTLKIALVAHPQDRQRSMSQLLFYMLRSGK